MFLAEQTILDDYNRRHPTLTHYRMVRVSKLHPTVHIKISGSCADLTVCGVQLYSDFQVSPEGGASFCKGCRKIMVRRLS